MCLLRVLMISTLLTAGVVSVAAEPAPAYCQWHATDFAIATPLCGLRGDAARGRVIAADGHAGNCLACHRMPIPEADFHGTVGPPLHGIGARYSAAQLRLRIVDEQAINPMTIMPGFYRDPAKANRIADDYFGRTMLTAQQIEDLVAYLATLK